MEHDLPRIENYVIGDELGEGGMGCVFAGSAPDGAAVAIKLLHPSLAGDLLVKAHLLEEARVASRVWHPNVVRTLDSGIASDGRPYLVMCRAMGSSLGLAIKDHGPVALQRVRRIATQILEGVGAIHAAGLVHGDLKSDNVLVDEHDRVTIIDFGLTRPQGSEPTWLGEDVLTGTPEYMAPEVIEGGIMTPAADIYAVGVIVYEMLSGTTPFAGGDANEIFERHVTDAVVPPSLRCDRHVPVALEGVVMRALAKAPSQRHHSARHFATAIERAIPPSWVEPPLPATSSAFSTTAATRSWQGRGSSPCRRRAPRPPVRNADEAIEMWIARAEVLVADHRLAAAADELSAAAAWLNAASPRAPRRWCLLATLAAVHAGLDHRTRARQVATSALVAARAAGDAAGIATARDLVQRFADRRSRA